MHEGRLVVLGMRMSTIGPERSKRRGLVSTALLSDVVNLLRHGSFRCCVKPRDKTWEPKPNAGFLPRIDVDKPLRLPGKCRTDMPGGFVDG